MLDTDAVTVVLHAMATGNADRALNVVALSSDLDEAERSALWRALDGDADPATRVRRFGDVLRSLGASRHLVNECYRVAFYVGDDWKRLASNPLFAYFASNRAGRPLDKWVHYLPIYEQHLERYRNRAVRVLEIGVYRGGGLDLLAHFLGPDAVLIGVDIDPGAVHAVAGRYVVELGDQEDPEFLRSVAERHGPFDIVLDDGGHRMRQQIVAVETLFPILADGGTYLVEDSHTSYWPEYADPAGPTFISWLKDRIDDLHAYHFSTAEDLAAPWQTSLAGLHLYDSVAVLEKGEHRPPFSEVAGTSEFINFNREASAIQLEVLATRDAAIAQADRLRIDAADAAAEAETAHEEVRLVRGEWLQTRDQVGRLETDVAALNEELAHLRDSLVGSWGIIEEMRRSASWRATAPLRRAKSLLLRR